MPSPPPKSLFVKKYDEGPDALHLRFDHPFDPTSSFHYSASAFDAIVDSFLTHFFRTLVASPCNLHSTHYQFSHCEHGRYTTTKRLVVSYVIGTGVEAVKGVGGVGCVGIRCVGAVDAIDGIRRVGSIDLIGVVGHVC
jgi:hypothetical protein